MSIRKTTSRTPPKNSDPAQYNVTTTGKLLAAFDEAIGKVPRTQFIEAFMRETVAQHQAGGHLAKPGQDVGLSHTIPDFRSHDFSRAIVSAKRVYLSLPDLPRFLSNPSHEAALLKRLGGKQFTRIFVPAFLKSDRSMFGLETECIRSIKAFFDKTPFGWPERYLSEEQQNRSENAYRRDAPFRILVLPNVNPMSLTHLFWTEHICAAALWPFAFYTNSRPAMVFTPTEEISIEEYISLQGGLVRSVRPNDSYHQHYGTSIEMISRDEGLHLSFNPKFLDEGDTLQ